MRATRIFSLTRADSVLVPPVIATGAAPGVIAGEACTELGCDAPGAGASTWLQRWLGLDRKGAPRTHERKGHGTQS